MLGYTEYSECLVWLQVKCAREVRLQYESLADHGRHQLTMQNPQKDLCKPAIFKFVPKDLTPGTRYRYSIFLDGKLQALPDTLCFNTKTFWSNWSKDEPYEFTFLTGSCNYVNDSAYDRPGKPYGQGTEIFKPMAASGADFMIWLGDNTYLREKDYDHEDGIRYRYMHTRADKNLQPFLCVMNHYAIWDDHDYGDNDASKSFDYKDVTRECFINYWGNKQYGQGNEGIYFSFRYADADFFMLDDRWFRDESRISEEALAYKTQLGEAQLSWLRDQLSHSYANFKFVVMGGQFLNEHTSYESYNIYKKERALLMDFIAKQKVNGVIFIDGDRHHSELIRNDSLLAFGGYALYDLTSSPISASPGNVLQTKEAENPQRVPQTLVAENNYCSVKVSGKRTDRMLTISCFGKTGDLKWSKEIHAADLKFKKE